MGSVGASLDGMEGGAGIAADIRMEGGAGIVADVEVSHGSC